VKGFYWVLGEGPARNSGGYEFDGTGGSQPWFIPGSPFPNGWSITTTVNNGQVVGCPAPDPTVFVFSDLTADGTSSVFGIAAADEDLSTFLNYDLGLATGAPGALVLQGIPDVTVTDARVAGTVLTVDLGWTFSLSFQSSSATVTDVSQVITGWNLYKSEVPSGSGAPISRNVADWTPIDTFPGVATTSGTATFACDDPANNQVFLAMAPDLDNGFTTTAYVGANSTRIECDGDLAEPGERKQLKTIDRPKRLRQR
jgi:hypothetical protein